MFKCHVCKEEEATSYCTQCGKPTCPNCLSEEVCWACSRPGIPQQPDRTQQLQLELGKWNWGGFGCCFIWAAAMNLWGWFVLGLLPVVSWFASFYLGVYGNRLAWQSRRWASFEQFKETQRIWNVWGIVFAIFAAFGLVIIWMASLSNALSSVQSYQ